MENISKIKYDNQQSVREKIEILRKGHIKKKLFNVDYRVEQLKKLKSALVKYEKEIHLSNKIDLGHQQFMSFFTSYNIVKSDVDDVLNNIYQWVSPRAVDTPLILSPAKSYVLPEPFGVCLIMSAWNTQYQTLIMPLAQAIAAGNVILAKPSEMAEASAIVCQQILAELDPDIVQVCQGGAEVSIELLKNKFDIIVFTGSPQKGVLVARAAAEFLTPCILELGGQNPVIVDKSANLEVAAHNVISGRFMICGQACIAPEYVLVEEEIYTKFLNILVTTVKKMFGKDPKNSLDYARIINIFHTERIAKLVSNANGKIIIGGEYDLKEKYIAPTIVSYESIKELAQSTLASSEIFGPIMYLSPYKKLDDCIDYINSKEKPLALYYFGTDNKNKDKIIRNTSSGAFVSNDCVVHFTNPDLPFGGVGSSGYSSYHGKWGFDNFSHLKPVMERSNLIVRYRYPPFDNSKQRVMTFLLKNAKYKQFKTIKVLSGSALLFAAYCFRNCFIGIFNNWSSKF